MFCAYTRDGSLGTKALILLAWGAGMGCFGCSGEDGKTKLVQSPISTNTALEKGDETPGMVVEVVRLAGGSGRGGNFQVGDRIEVTFTVKKNDGTSWRLSELFRGRALVSGPTSNYQRVIPEQDDVLTASVQNPDGSFTYRFSQPIPATYLAPYNDSPSFGELDGELTGQALLPGTYTIGLYLVWSFTVDGESFRDADDETVDFLLGSASTLEPREVVGQANCNACHETLQAHGQQRRSVTLCLLCHTAGAEDRNVASAAGGTPGASIDFRVMVHRLHNGKHLPSVLGVMTNADGTRDYSATPQPYQLVGFNDTVLDFSHLAFPAMPSAYVAYTYDTTGSNYTGAVGNGPMPRDTGYASLPGPRKALEDEMRSGLVVCGACHGDPDGEGPIEAPAQGDLHKTQPTRQACGSCHDDVEWGQPYTANNQTMPAQANNSNCTLCHRASGNNLATEDAHRHPYLDPDHNTGVQLEISEVGGGSGPGGRHTAGDPVIVTFSVRDDSGSDLPIHSLTRLQMIITGPSSNPQWLIPNVNPFDFALRRSSPFTGNGTATALAVDPAAMEQTIAVVFTSATAFEVDGSVTAVLGGQAIGANAGDTAQVSYNGVSFTLTQGATPFAAGDRFYLEVVPLATRYARHVPRDWALERAGEATAGAKAFGFANTPAYWGRQAVFERTALVGSETDLVEALPALGRYAACDSSALALAVGDRVVLGDGTDVEEYLQVARIQTTDDRTGADLGAGDRVWFTNAVRYAHDEGSPIQECTLTGKREGIDYTMEVAEATGFTTLAGRFGAGNPVVVSYRTHARFGQSNAPGEERQDIYAAAATGDTDDIDASWGDWKGLPLVDGTYTVGLWANRDFTVTPLGALIATEAFNNIATDNTTYRMMAEPATREFLFGSAMTIMLRSIIPSGDACNRCHSDIAAHGFGRRGWETCELCHATPGAEDGAKYTFPTWYVGATEGVTVDFRSMLHKIHMGKELARGSDYVVNGVFLGIPYPVSYDDVGFPVLPGGPRNCETCHGEDNDAWLEPAPRDHPTVQAAKTREWRGACGSCHDSDSAEAHISLNTLPTGEEACSICHGPGNDLEVRRVHKAY